MIFKENFFFWLLPMKKFFLFSFISKKRFYKVLIFISYFFFKKIKKFKILMSWIEKEFNNLHYFVSTLMGEESICK